MWESCLFCLGGVEIFLKGGENKFFFCVFKLGGELEFTLFYLFILYSVSYYCLYVFLSTHAVMCLLSVSGKTSTF